ncbi:hypothetical protein J6590_012674 [Homalodisca vitripennis]|nr:hypothetical protein J6590_012674 [Homalodisca vitripennis]
MFLIAQLDSALHRLSPTQGRILPHLFIEENDECSSLPFMRFTDPQENQFRLEVGAMTSELECATVPVSDNIGAVEYSVAQYNKYCAMHSEYSAAFGNAAEERRFYANYFSSHEQCIASKKDF